MAEAPAPAPEATPGDPTPDPTPEPAPTPEPTATPPEPELGDAGKKALDAEREARKAAEKRARDASKELEEFRRSTMSDSEKALDEARSTARAETLREVGGRLVDAEVRAATAGRNVDVDALLEGLDRTKFLTDDGDVDGKAVAEWIDRLAPKTDPDPEPTPGSVFDFGQGARGAPEPDAGEAFTNNLLKQLGRR